MVHEGFGDGIVSAIGCDMRLERQPDRKGGRARIAMGGKFLPCKRYWGST